MGFKEATPGLLISLISIVLLAIVSFNTPILKSLYFLKATYSDYEITFGTLGYCETSGSSTTNTTCTGPTIGYEFDFATTFGVTETVISIPNVVTKLTYVLIVHVAALVCSVIALLLGALSHIRDFSLLCFPSLFAYLTSSLALLAFVIDLIIFYIMRARINALSGASATIGVCVWLTLAAWVVTAIAGCCFTLGTCCVGRNRRGQDEAGKYRGVNDREKNAFVMGNQDGKAKGPAMLEREVSTPLIGADGEPVEDKFLQPEGGYLDANGNPIGGGADTINGVGYGYGRRTPRVPSEAAGGGLHPFLATDPAEDGHGDHYAAYAPSHPGAGRSGTPSTIAGSFVGVGAGRSMQTVPWAGSGAGGSGGGGGAVIGAPGYVPGGSQGQGYGGQQGQGGYDSYDQQQPSQGHHYQDPYGQSQTYDNPYDNNYQQQQQAQQAHAEYNDSQMYGQDQSGGPIQPTPRRLDQSAGMGNIVSPVESNHGYGGGGGYGGGQEPQETLSNAYGGYSNQQHHLAPAPMEDGTGDIGGARPPSYDSAQVYSAGANQRYRGY